MAKKRKERSMESSCTASTATKSRKTTAAILVAEAENKENKKDLFSDLPDDILYHILSFFPSTKLQVCTSILSKRWRHLWTHSPTLIFPYDFKRLRDPSYQYELSVDHCLQLCKAPAVRQLKLYIKPESTASEGWLDFAASRHTREIELESVYGHPQHWGIEHILPSLLRCKNLTILCLKNFNINLPGLSFPCLSSLTLSNVYLEFETLNALLSSSPLLQTLELLSVRLNPRMPDQCLLITHLVNPRLNKLVCHVDCIVEVDSPYIRSFRYFAFEDGKLRRPPPFVLLTHLTLRYVFHPIIDNLPPSMPSLRSLTLNGVQIPHLMLSRLISSSPLLQTLELSRLDLLPQESVELQTEGNLKKIEMPLLISHPRLENLTLNNISNSSRLEVASPNLRTFRFTGPLNHLSLAHTPHLQLAELRNDNSTGGTLSVSCRNQIFSAISKAKTLHITSEYMCRKGHSPMKLHKPLPVNPGSRLQNLKKLNYRFLSHGAFMFVHFLSVLAECPYIENLCIEFCIVSLPKTVDEEAMAKWLEVYQSPPFETLKRFELTMKNLKTIQLISLPYSEYALVFLDSLLQRAVALETLGIERFKYERRRERNRKLNNWIRSVASQGFEVQIKDLEFGMEVLVPS